MIRENLKRVENNIAKACQKAGRNPNSITLVAVSKTMPVAFIQEAYSIGIRDFGENRVQEICSKKESLPSDVRWHMIGHLQTNKVKQVIDKAVLIHSVDSLSLAKEIDQCAANRKRIVPILVEVNIGEEDTKFGIHEEETLSFVESLAKLNNIQVKGLMTVAPYTEYPEENRNFFRKIKQLSVDINSKNIHNISMDILSMGMTNDYMVAIEEGATLVRVGTGIFGQRNYQ